MGWASPPSFWDGRDAHPTITIKIVSYLIPDPYGFCSLALLVSSGVLLSVNRCAYAIVSLSIALGLLLAAKPRWGYGLMGLFGVFLLYVSVRFAALAVGSLGAIALNIFFINLIYSISQAA
ncbi:hypothetical protein [Microcoleus sp. OTE_8_concoct_300]|uniref:hypothetical protein n=1 Tax=Microcoleus sp. OTE_8_concoct_300 TaxID=2964710 RepID=UPI00403F197A